MGLNHFKIHKGLTLNPQPSAPSSPTDGDIYYNSSSNRFEFFQNSKFRVLGSGGGGALNFYENGSAELATSSDFVTGNNATFDNGGSLQGVFSLSTTAADLIRGDTTYKLVLHATPGTSDDDFVSSEANEIPIPQGYRNQTLSVKIKYRYDGADDDIKWVVKDDTNTAILTTGSELLEQYIDAADNSSKTLTLSFFCPGDCENVKVGPQVLTHAAGSEVLTWDDVIITPDPFVDKDLFRSSTLRVATGNGHGSTNTKIKRFSTTVENTGTDIDFVDDVTDGSSFTVKAAGTYRIDWNDGQTAAGSGTLGISLNSSQLTTNIESITAADRLSLTKWQNNSVSSLHLTGVTLNLEVGDVIRAHDDGNNDQTTLASLTITSFIAVDQVVAFNERSQNSMIRVNTGNGDGSVNTKIRRFSTTVESIGNAITFLDDASDGSTFTINEPGIYHMTLNDGQTAAGSGTIGISKNSSQLTTNIESITAADRLALTKWQLASVSSVNNSDATVILAKGDVIRVHSDGNNNQTTLAQFTITKIGVSQLLGAPLPLTVYLKNIQTSGTAAGGSTANTVQTLVVNTVEGDTSIVSVAADQFTFGPGTYDFDGEATAYKTEETQVFLHDGTSYVLNGQTAESAAADGVQVVVPIRGRLVFTVSTTLEFRQWTSATQAVDGLGRAADVDASNPQAAEVYNTLKVTKVN